MAPRSYAEVEPALADVRLVAATLPGNAGTLPPEDYSIEGHAQGAAALARSIGANLVVGPCGGGRNRTHPALLGAAPVLKTGRDTSPHSPPA